MTTLKGKRLRVLLLDGDKYKVVGKSTNATITLTGNTDDASTKDDVILFSKPEITSKSWSVQVESLDVPDTAAVLNAIKNLTPFTLIWDEVEPGDNQTMQQAGYARTGTAYLNDVTFQWDDRTNSTKQLQFTGVGALQKIATKPTQDLVENDDAYTKGQFVRLFLGSDNSAVPAKIVAAAKSLSLHVSMSLEDGNGCFTGRFWSINFNNTSLWHSTKP